MRLFAALMCCLFFTLSSQLVAQSAPSIIQVTDNTGSVHAD